MPSEASETSHLSILTSNDHQTSTSSKPIKDSISSLDPGFNTFSIASNDGDPSSTLKYYLAPYSYSFEINFDVSGLEEINLIEVLYDSSIDRMIFDIPIMINETKNLFTIKDDLRKLFFRFILQLYSKLELSFCLLRLYLPLTFMALSQMLLFFCKFFFPYIHFEHIFRCATT